MKRNFTKRSKISAKGRVLLSHGKKMIKTMLVHAPEHIIFYLILHHPLEALINWM